MLLTVAPLDRFSFPSGHTLHAVVFSTIVTAHAPALGWVVGRALGLGGLELKVVMILMACPTAIVSYTMALEMKGDEALASGAIVLSVVTSLAALAVVVGCF